MPSKAEVSTYLNKVDLVRSVLMESWDPIGVKDVDAAQDEYDMYIPGLIRLIEQGETAEAIAEHLSDIVSSRMGLVPDVEIELKVARQLLQLSGD